MTDLADLSAVDLARAYESGDASPRDALRAVRARIEAWEPTINALWHRDDAAADRQGVAPRIGGDDADPRAS
jgi:aspartyl-tRNA(Asn)/glutamyl-tRNA(Gln) amidotransferase subunit A